MSIAFTTQTLDAMTRRYGGGSILRQLPTRVPDMITQINAFFASAHRQGPTRSFLNVAYCHEELTRRLPVRVVDVETPNSFAPSLLQVTLRVDLCGELRAIAFFLRTCTLFNVGSTVPAVVGLHETRALRSIQQCVRHAWETHCLMLLHAFGQRNEESTSDIADGSSDATPFFSTARLQSTVHTCAVYASRAATLIPSTRDDAALWRVYVQLVRIFRGNGASGMHCWVQIDAAKIQRRLASLLPILHLTPVLLDSAAAIVAGVNARASRRGGPKGARFEGGGGGGGGAIDINNYHSTCRHHNHGSCHHGVSCFYAHHSLEIYRSVPRVVALHVSGDYPDEQPATASVAVDAIPHAAIASRETDDDDDDDGDNSDNSDNSDDSDGEAALVARYNQIKAQQRR